MNHYSTFLVFVGLALLSFFYCRNSAIGMLKIGINQRYYPKHYIAPHRWMKKLYKFKESSIPKYLFVEFYMAIIFAVLGPINFLVFLFANSNNTTAGILIMIHSCLIILNSVFFILFSYMFKKK